MAIAVLVSAFSTRSAAETGPLGKQSRWPQITNILTTELTQAKDDKPPMSDIEMFLFMNRLLRGQDPGWQDVIAHIYQNARVDRHRHLNGTVVCFFPGLNVFYIYGDCAMNHLDEVAGPFKGDPRRALKQLEKIRRGPRPRQFDFNSLLFPFPAPGIDFVTLSCPQSKRLAIWPSEKQSKIS